MDKQNLRSEEKKEKSFNDSLDIFDPDLIVWWVPIFLGIVSLLMALTI